MPMLGHLKLKCEICAEELEYPVVFEDLYGEHPPTMEAALIPADGWFLGNENTSARVCPECECSLDDAVGAAGYHKYFTDSIVLPHTVEDLIAEFKEHFSDDEDHGV